MHFEHSVVWLLLFGSLFGLQSAGAQQCDSRTQRVRPLQRPASSSAAPSQSSSRLTWQPAATNYSAVWVHWLHWRRAARARSTAACYCRTRPQLTWLKRPLSHSKRARTLSFGRSSRCVVARSLCAVDDKGAGCGRCGDDSSRELARDAPVNNRQQATGSARKARDDNKERHRVANLLTRRPPKALIGARARARRASITSSASSSLLLVDGRRRRRRRAGES